MLKGFMIFLTATGWPVNWSRAELSGSPSGQRWDISHAARWAREDSINDIPDQAERAHTYRLQVGIPGSCEYQQLDLARSHIEASGGAHRLVISKVVPKIWDRTNSAMMESNVNERQITESRRKKVFRSEGLRSEVWGTEKWRTESRRDPKRPGGAQTAEQARIGPREEMWGRALSVNSAENTDDDVCDQRAAGFAMADITGLACRLRA